MFEFRIAHKHALQGTIREPRISMQNLCMCDDGESPIVLLLVLASRLQLSRTQLQKVLFNLHVEAPEVLDLLLDFLHGEVLFGKGFEFHFLKLGVVLVRDVDDLGYLPFHIRSLAHGALEVDDLQHWALADIGEQLAPVLLDHLVKLIDARLLHTVAVSYIHVVKGTIYRPITSSPSCVHAYKSIYISKYINSYIYTCYMYIYTHVKVCKLIVCIDTYMLGNPGNA